MSGASKVLIVDDEPNVRLVFRTTLEAAGYDVTEAADGELALKGAGRLRKRTWWSWISGCPVWTALKCSGACARRITTRRW